LANSASNSATSKTQQSEVVRILTPQVIPGRLASPSGGGHSWKNNEK
jgi:hypothetical protein